MKKQNWFYIWLVMSFLLINACGGNERDFQFDDTRFRDRRRDYGNFYPEPQPSPPPLQGQNPPPQKGMQDIQRFLENQGNNKSIFRVYRKDEIKVTFANVAGLESAKKSLTDIVNYLKAPKDFIRLGAEPPTGVIFFGPPGTGKTEIARALAGEVAQVRNVTFIVASGASFENKYVGVGADNVRKLFALARQNKPAIIFIDEFDALAGKRSDAKKNAQVVNQLLTELDGFDKEERQNIFILAATNNLKDIDPAVIRAGRIDRKIEIGLPNAAARKAILEHYLKKEPVITDIDVAGLVNQTDTWSAADLKTLVNEARINATLRNAQKIEQVDMDQAVVTVRVSKLATS